MNKKIKNKSKIKTKKKKTFQEAKKETKEKIDEKFFEKEVKLNRELAKARQEAQPFFEEMLEHYEELENTQDNLGQVLQAVVDQIQVEEKKIAILDEELEKTEDLLLAEKEEHQRQLQQLDETLGAENRKLQDQVRDQRLTLQILKTQAAERDKYLDEEAYLAERERQQPKRFEEELYQANKEATIAIYKQPIIQEEPKEISKKSRERRFGFEAEFLKTIIIELEPIWSKLIEEKEKYSIKEKELEWIVELEEQSIRLVDLELQNKFKDLEEAESTAAESERRPIEELEESPEKELQNIEPGKPYNDFLTDLAGKIESTINLTEASPEELVQGQEEEDNDEFEMEDALFKKQFDSIKSISHNIDVHLINLSQENIQEVPITYERNRPPKIYIGRLNVDRSEFMRHWRMPRFGKSKILAEETGILLLHHEADDDAELFQNKC